MGRKKVERGLRRGGEERGGRESNKRQEELHVMWIY